MHGLPTAARRTQDAADGGLRAQRDTWNLDHSMVSLEQTRLELFSTQVTKMTKVTNWLLAARVGELGNEMTVPDLQSILLLAIRKFIHVLNVCSSRSSCAEDLQERTRTIDDCCYRCTYHNPSGDEDKACELRSNRQLPSKYVDP